MVNGFIFTPYSQKKLFTDWAEFTACRLTTYSDATTILNRFRSVSRFGFPLLKLPRNQNIPTDKSSQKMARPDKVWIPRLDFPDKRNHFILHSCLVVLISVKTGCQDCFLITDPPGDHRDISKHNEKGNRGTKNQGHWQEKYQGCAVHGVPNNAV